MCVSNDGRACGFSLSRTGDLRLVGGEGLFYTYSQWLLGKFRGQYGLLLLFCIPLLALLIETRFITAPHPPRLDLSLWLLRFIIAIHFILKLSYSSQHHKNKLEHLRKMASDQPCFNLLNSLHPASLPPEMDYFTLTAPPGTEIWREPGKPDIVSAPLVHTALREPLIVAEVTITANWEMEWDQAGLIIVTGQGPDEREDPDAYAYRREGLRRRWVKAGLEFSMGILHVATTVAISPSGADLSMATLPGSSRDVQHALPLPSVRIKLERMGNALWIWYHQQGSTWCATSAEASSDWTKVREIAGFFWGLDRKTGVWIGCYASRPTLGTWDSDTTGGWREDDSSDGLWVEFEDLDII